MALIELDNVSKVYGSSDESVKALDHTSLQIEEGDFVAIMGPSGSGKSTLLSILGVLNKPTSGKVVVDGIDVHELDVERQADFRLEYLGFVFQSFQLIPYLTVAENVMLPFSISKIAGNGQRQKALDVLEKVGLGGKHDRLPDHISGGEGQRVAVARALVNKPPILLADEPTGNLDSKTGEQVLDLLKNLNREGQTIVMVTHDEKIASHAHRTINLLDGRVVN